MNYKLSKPRFHGLWEKEVVDILKKKKILFFEYWSHHDTIVNSGQAEEVVYLLNNPAEMKKRLKESANVLIKQFRNETIVNNSQN